MVDSTRSCIYLDSRHWPLDNITGHGRKEQKGEDNSRLLGFLLETRTLDLLHRSSGKTHTAKNK